jgi:acylphosphatase
MADVAQRVHYSGHVQGVGFRYTTHLLASGRRVRGYVRNLPTGEVELWAEGPAEEVDAFLTSVAERLSGFITGVRSERLPPAGVTGFTIRR